VSNYPPGVTGNEYEISGPTYERETVQHYCDGCERMRLGVVTGFYRDWADWECYTCGWIATLPTDEAFT